MECLPSLKVLSVTLPPVCSVPHISEEDKQLLKVQECLICTQKIVAHKECPKGDAGRQLEASFGRCNLQRSVLRETQGPDGKIGKKGHFGAF
ncbi:unnamed protein product [Prunus armeniaca]